MAVNYQDLLDEYGSLAAAAANLGYAKQTVHNWKSKGIPTDQQVEIHRKTKGKLCVDAKMLSRFREVLRAA